MKTTCGNCGHSVYAIKGRLVEHDLLGHKLPRSEPKMPTGKLSEQIRERRRARILRGMLMWAGRRRCPASGSEAAS